MRDSYAVVVAARNEEQCIGETISAILEQSLPPDTVVVIDDGSTDGTPDILRDTPGIVTITNPPHEESYLHDPRMNAVRNKGFTAVARSKFRYVLNMDGDIILPRNYSREVIGRMQGSGVVVASGSLSGERPAMPMDTGRMIDSEWFERIGYRYAENFGGETHLVIKAYVTGHKTAVYHDLILGEARKTGRHYTSKSQYKFGRAYRALGLSWYYAMWRTTHGRSQKMRTSYHFMRGYLAKTDAYEPDVRSWMRGYQSEQIRCKILRKRNPLETRTGNSVVIGERAADRHESRKDIDDTARTHSKG